MYIEQPGLGPMALMCRLQNSKFIGEATSTVNWTLKKTIKKHQLETHLCVVLAQNCTSRRERECRNEVAKRIWTAWGPVPRNLCTGNCTLQAVIVTSGPTYGAFPLPDSDSYSDYCTHSDSMQKCYTGTDSYGDSYANHRHFTILFEKLIVVSIEPLLACLVIPTTGLFNNFHSFNK